jgi:hypothetical protein
MAKRKPVSPAAPATVEVIELLVAAIDGIDGYESEHGDLRYWNAVSIDRARHLLESLEAGPMRPPEPRGFLSP